jgi:hypothetical protein
VPASKQCALSLATLALLMFVFACGGNDDPQPPDPEDTLHVTLGTGEAEFQPIDGEPRLRLVAGIQGGFHVWASFLVYDYPGDSLDMVLDTHVDGNDESEIVMRAHLQLHDTLDPAGAPAQFFAGFPAQIYDARCAQDKRVAVHVRLASGDGLTGEDTRYCIAEVDEQQRREDCE